MINGPMRDAGSLADVYNIYRKADNLEYWPSWLVSRAEITAEAYYVTKVIIFRIIATLSPSIM